MNMQTDRLDRELRHLKEGPALDEKPAGMGTVRFIARCDGDSWQVLAKAKAVLIEFDQAAMAEWPDNSDWTKILPKWFLEKCAPEQTREQAEESLKLWRALSWEEQARAEREELWPLSACLYWLNPENRKWFWWDAEERDANTIVIAAEVDDWPFPWGSLAWLFRAAGATHVNSEG